MGFRISFALPLWILILTFGITVSCAFAQIPPYNPAPTKVSPDWRNRCISSSKIKLSMPDGKVLAPVNFVAERSLNDSNWKFSGVVNSATADDRDLTPDSYKADFDDSGWDNIAVPLNWYLKYSRPYLFPDEFKKHYFKGVYRRKINLTEAEIQEHCVVLDFGVIGYEASLFVNGKLAGKHHGDFVPWNIDITPFVHPGENVIAIRVVSDFATFPAVRTYGSQWARSNFKAGIWQEAWLKLEPKIRLTQILVTPELSNGGISIDAKIINNTGVAGKYRPGVIVSAAWKSVKNPIDAAEEFQTMDIASGNNSFHGFVKLNNPVKWTPDNPYLYFMTLYLRDGSGNIVDAVPVRFGYRDFKVQGKNFYLNGERIYLFGENFPSVNYGGSGKPPAEEASAIAKDLADYKAHGYNILRNSHMPALPVFYDIADELGMMIYDEWSWCFTSVIKEKEFQFRNDKELAEWIYRDYNHPSVVMWSGGNEVPHYVDDAVRRQLDRQVDIIRKLDVSGRPVSSFSGSACQLTYGMAKLNTDVLDAHNYMGMAVFPWTSWNECFESDYKRLAMTYTGSPEALNKPYIIWECVGFSWGWHTNKDFKQNDVRQYADYVAKESISNWGEHYGIGLSGSIGLHAALTQSVYVGRAPYGKRILGLIRQNDNIQGFAPWFSEPRLPESIIWNQPVYCGLRNDSYIPPRNIFWAEKYERIMFVVNSTNRKLENLDCKIELAMQTGKVFTLAEKKVATIEPWQQYAEKITFNLPAGSKVENAQMRIKLSDAGGEISRNYYDVFVQDIMITQRKITNPHKTAILDCGKQKDVQKVVAMLNSLGVDAKVIDSQNGPFDEFDVLIIPPAMTGLQKQVNREALMSRVQKGGRLLVLEQDSGKLVIPDGYSLVSPSNTFVDLVIPEHPVFRTLNQDCFDTWDGNKNGVVVAYGIEPFSLNAIAVRGPLLNRKGVGMAAMEAVWGSGRIFVSEFYACRLWKKDSAATTYLVNLFEYFIGRAPLYDKAQPLVLVADRAQITDPSKLVPINLSNYANRNFADSSREGGEKGWTGQGKENDLRNIATGRQMVGSVPFEVIEPKKNNGKAAIILRGSGCPDLPVKISGIKIGEKFKRIFFLHGLSWNSGGTAGCYRFHYKDGQTVDFTIVEDRHIGDWWNVRELPEAWRGLTTTNGMGQPVGLFVTEWKNPRPDVEIVSMDFISAGGDDKINYSSAATCVPFLVSVTGEQ